MQRHALQHGPPPRPESEKQVPERRHSLPPVSETWHVVPSKRVSAHRARSSTPCGDKWESADRRRRCTADRWHEARLAELRQAELAAAESESLAKAALRLQEWFRSKRASWRRREHRAMCLADSDAKSILLTSNAAAAGLTGGTKRDGGKARQRSRTVEDNHPQSSRHRARRAPTLPAERWEQMRDDDDAVLDEAIASVQQQQLQQQEQRNGDCSLGMDSGSDGDDSCKYRGSMIAECLAEAE